MHKTIRLDPTTGRDPLRELDDFVRALLDEGRHITITIADDDERRRAARAPADQHARELDRLGAPLE